MRQTNTLHENFVLHTYIQWSSQVAASPCWKLACPGVLSAHLSPQAWTYLPVLPLVHLPGSSQETSAFTTSGSARQRTTSVQRLPYGANFGTISHSLMFRPAGLLATQVAPPAVFPLGSRGFYVRAYYGLFPPRTSDMLAVRSGQLTAWGLAPHKIRGLAGRSPEAIAPGHPCGATLSHPAVHVQADLSRPRPCSGARQSCLAS
jgi:hypothetical protein